MTIRIVCAGKLKEKYITEAVEDYRKRLSRFASVEIQEVPDERIPDNASAAEERIAVDREGERLLSKIQSQDFVIALAIDGRSLSSESFADYLRSLQNHGRSSVAFVIGGSLGLSSAVMERADAKLSLSAMTFPHRLARILILEQTYRAFKILNNEPYHK